MGSERSRPCESADAAQLVHSPSAANMGMGSNGSRIVLLAGFQYSPTGTRLALATRFATAEGSVPPVGSWLCKLWREESGSLLATEWAFVATILMLAVLCTAATTRCRMHHCVEMGDSESISALVSGSNTTVE